MLSVMIVERFTRPLGPLFRQHVGICFLDDTGGVVQLVGGSAHSLFNGKRPSDSASGTVEFEVSTVDVEVSVVGEPLHHTSGTIGRERRWRDLVLTAGSENLVMTGEPSRFNISIAKSVVERRKV
jgi:hypothetical protein